MIKRLCLITSVMLAAALASSTANALVFSGSFSGTVTDSRIGADSPYYNGENINGEHASGTFYLNTDLSGIPPEFLDNDPSDGISNVGQDTSLIFYVHGGTLDYSGNACGCVSFTTLTSDSSGQTLGIGRFGFPLYEAYLTFGGAPGSLFGDFNQDTFQPLNVDPARSSARFEGGRGFGGSLILDSITFDGYGTVGVPEPASYGLMLFGVGLMTLFKRRSATARSRT